MQAVAKVLAWRAEAGLPVPASDTSSYCVARRKLENGFLDGANDMVLGRMAAAVGGEERWHGMMLKALDGSSVRLMDTPENQLAYPQWKELPGTLRIRLVRMYIEDLSGARKRLIVATNS